MIETPNDMSDIEDPTDDETQLRHDDRTTTIELSDARSWLFTAEGFTLDACQQAKKVVADAHDDVRYLDLRARKVNRDKIGGTLGDEYICVVEAFNGGD